MDMEKKKKRLDVVYIKNKDCLFPCEILEEKQVAYGRIILTIQPLNGSGTMRVYNTTVQRNLSE